MSRKRSSNTIRARRRRVSPKVSRNINGCQGIIVERQLIQNIPKVASDTGNFRSYNLSQFPDADIVSLFQEYRIKSVTLTWMLVNAPNNNASFPTLYVAPQHIFTGSPPANRDEVIQYRGIQTYQYGPSRIVYKRKFIPFVPLDASTTGKKFVSSPWLSTTTDTVPHYTDVEWISRYNSTTDPTHTIELLAHAVIECRHTR